MAAGKTKGRSAKVTTRATSAETPPASKPDKAEPARAKSQGAGAAPRQGVGVFPIVVVGLAGSLLVLGVAIMAMALYAFDNLSQTGPYTVDEQIQMVTSGVYAGAALAAAGLVTLGLVAVALRLGRG